MTIDDRIKQSRLDFEHVWSAFAAVLDGGDLMAIEGLPSPVAKTLDRAGIDAYQVTIDGRVVPLCSRVQYHPLVYSSFTIRHITRWGNPKTEALRLLRGRIAGDLTGWTCQSYLDWPDGALLIGAAIRTTQLADYLDASGFDDEKVNGEDGTRFGVIWWHCLTESGAEVRRTRSTAASHRRPHGQLIPDADGWTCPRCGQSATTFYGAAGQEVCRPCWTPADSGGRQ